VSFQQPGKPAGIQPGYGSPQRSPNPLGRKKKNGATVFRNVPPLLVWWAWLAFALANIIYLIRDGFNYGDRVGSAVLLLATGVIYACTLHSRVESDDKGVTVYNPLFDHHAPWGAVEGIYVGDSVEFRCLRPEPAKPKTVYSWALYGSRRSRARSQMQRDIFTMRGARDRPAPSTSGSGKSQPSSLMAAELAEQAKTAKEAGAAPGYLRTTWAWIPAAAIVAPAILVLLAWLVR
jgi:hypothetical protein